MEWSNDLSLKLIEEYKNRPLLWDTNHKYYNLTKRKNSAWEEIAQLFNSDVVEIRKKMNSLLSSFRRERRREGIPKAGSPVKGFYHSKWFAFDSLATFLMDDYNPGSFCMDRSMLNTSSNDGLEHLSVNLFCEDMNNVDVKMNFDNYAASETSETEKETKFNPASEVMLPGTSSQVCAVIPTPTIANKNQLTTKSIKRHASTSSNTSENSSDNKETKRRKGKSARRQVTEEKPTLISSFCNYLAMELNMFPQKQSSALMDEILLLVIKEKKKLEESVV